MKDYYKIMWDGLINGLETILFIGFLAYKVIWVCVAESHLIDRIISICLCVFISWPLIDGFLMFSWRSILQILDLREEPEERTGKIYSISWDTLMVFRKTKVFSITFWGDYKGRGHKLHMCFGVQSIGMFADDDRVAYKIYPRSRVIVEMRKCPILPAKVTSIKSAAELKRLIEEQEEVTFLFRKNEYALSGYYTKKFLRPERFEYLFVRYSDDSSKKEVFYSFEDALQVKLSKGKRLAEVLEEIQIVS